MDSSSSLSVTTRIAETVKSGALACMESAARSSFGRTILRFIDRFLWVVEKSTQWSLPCREETAEENGKSFGETTLVRPLPWIFFLPGLLVLRALRAGINVGASILGYPKLEPSQMVKYLQKSRRRLRAIKTNGMKNMRERRDHGGTKDRETTPNAKWRFVKLIRSIRLTLSSLSCLDVSKFSPSPPPTKIKVRANHESTPTPEEKSTTESASSPIMHVESKRKYSQVSLDDSEDETIREKIDRLAALDNSIDDDDFTPADLSNSTNDSSSISEESSGVSATEIQDIRDEANLFLYRALAGVAEIIKEEPEVVRRGASHESQETKFENPKTDFAPENSRENSQENQEYYSPLKRSGEEGDTAFYSPISSKSSSPERTATAPEQSQQDERGNIGQNGKLNLDSKAQISGSPKKTTNGHVDEAKCASTTGTNAYPTKANKSHYRGRRTANASRKKK